MTRQHAYRTIVFFALFPFFLKTLLNNYKANFLSVKIIMERAFKCDICSEKFKSLSKLNHHISREHGKPAVLPKKRFDCNVCDKKFSKNRGLIDHIKTHTGERPFKCTAPDCGKAFAQR